MHGDPRLRRDLNGVRTGGMHKRYATSQVGSSIRPTPYGARTAKYWTPLPLLTDRYHSPLQ